MTPDNDQEDSNAQMTEAIGEVVGEVLVIISQIVKALRQQPGFDNSSFENALRDMLSQADASVLQKHTLQMILDQKSQSTD